MSSVCSICLPSFWAFAHPPGCRGVYGGSDSSVHIWGTPAHSASALAASGKPSPRFPHSLPGSPGLYPSQNTERVTICGEKPPSGLSKNSPVLSKLLPQRPARSGSRSYQELLLSRRSQRADRELQSAHRQGVRRDRNAEALIETHLALWLQGCAAVKRTGPAGVQWKQVYLHVPAQAGNSPITAAYLVSQAEQRAQQSVGFGTSIPQYGSFLSFGNL